jgi:hypothetical protein
MGEDMVIRALPSYGKALNTFGRRQLMSSTSSPSTGEVRLDRSIGLGGGIALVVGGIR